MDKVSYLLLYLAQQTLFHLVQRALLHLAQQALPNWPTNCKFADGTPGGKIIIYMPGAPLMVPYQEFSTSSTGPAHRYQIHMLTGPYLLFRNQLIGNKGSYWLVQILWFWTVLLEITYISKLLSST